MFSSILKSIFGSRNDRLLKKYNVLLKKINGFESSLKLLSDEDLKTKFTFLKIDCKNVNDLDSLLPLVYSIVREVSFRVLKMRHYDVQVLGGISLYYGKISEIATGEGKTLVATLPVCLYSLLGKPVHVITVNDYLAKRDADWMRPVYDFLEVSVGVILSGMLTHDRKISYACNVVYGTSSEFGFDYLRDNIVLSKDEKVQGFLFYAIVDEVDSILIDEARTPLIISLPVKFESEMHILINKLIKNLVMFDSISKKGHFILEEKNKQIQLTDSGFSYLECLFKEYGILGDAVNLYDVKNIELLHYVYASLKAHNFFKKDVDYIIRDNIVLIIDEHTGRIMDGRRWGDGIHQAIEAKELLPIRSENQTLASITFQNYFRLYDRLSGMTGTAYTESLEFRSIYGLEVIVLPTNKPCVRDDRPDLIFLTREYKFKAVVDDIKKCYFSGIPVLVGTISIAVSEFLSKMLNQLGIKHNVLNAKYHDKESKIIAEAGKLKGVTIATNMAGRGTDIVLGGSILDTFSKKLNNYNDVVRLGGLKIIGTERHESRRIDNQLRGRSGRQGDPGCSQFYLSLEDDLVRIFVGDKTKSLLNKLSVSNAEVISHPLINRSIENAQKKVEAYNFDIRKELLEFDDIINEQRKVIYKYRDYLIFNMNISSIVFDIFKDVVSLFIDRFLTIDNNKFYSSKDILKSFNFDFGFKLTSDLDVADKNFFLNLFFDSFYEGYMLKKIDIRESDFLSFEKYLLLNVLDVKWKEHLVNLDYMKKGIHLRGYAQKDPKQEYKREAFFLFDSMLNNVKNEFVSLFFKFSIKSSVNNSDSHLDDKNLSFEHTDAKFLGNDDNVKKKKPFIRKQVKIGRNKLCFCSSGKKYKQCHGKV